MKSQIAVKALWPSQDRSETLRRLTDPRGAAPMVWKALAQVYLGVAEPYRTDGKGWLQDSQAVFGLHTRKDVPRYARALLLFTNDFGYVSKADYGLMVDDISKFIARFPAPRGVPYHWHEIGQLFEIDPDCEALGLWDTQGPDPFKTPCDWMQCLDVYHYLRLLENPIENFNPKARGGIGG